MFQVCFPSDSYTLFRSIMRVLLVNAYSDPSSSAFRLFESCIKTVLFPQVFAQPRQLSLVQVDFDTVDLASLPKYLYEPGSKYMSSDARKVRNRQLFDHTDVVFVDGEANLLPWLPKAEKLIVLMRMIETTRKLVFAASCGMQALVYLKACGHPIKRVINGHGKGGSVQDVQSLSPSELHKLAHDEVLLDNTTGDVYQYDHKRREFTPVANVGLHYHRAAQDSLIARSSMLKSSTYIPHVIDDPYPIYMGKLNEAKCRVLKQCNQHWLVQGLGLQPFLVPQHNAWDMHPVNITSEANSYFVLAESERGPQVVTWGEKMVGVQFRIDPKYAETMVVLRNFVDQILAGFEQEEARADIPLGLVEHHIKTVGVKINTHRDTQFPSETIYSTDVTRPETAKSRFSALRPTTASTVATAGLRPSSAVAGRHSGFAFSRRYHAPLIVPNNATTDVAISAANSRRAPSFGSESPAPTNRGKSLNQSPINTAERVKTQTVAAVSPAFYQSPDLTHSEKTGLNTFEYRSIVSSVPDGSVPWKKQEEIRALLHPAYNITGMSKRGIGKYRSESTMTAKKIIRLKIQRVSYSSRTKSDLTAAFAKSRTTLYPNLGLTVANDGGLYKDPEARLREEQREGRKKWVNARNFDLALSKSPRPANPPISVHLTPSEPANQHAFREEKKGKWLAGQFKVASY